MSKVVCPYCEEELNPKGLYGHVLGKHPEKFLEFKEKNPPQKNLRECYQKLRKEHEELKEKYRKLQEEHEKLRNDYFNMKKNYETLKRVHHSLKTFY